MQLIGNYISSDRTDEKTLMPYMERPGEYCSIKRLCADAGYESEENNYWFKQLETKLYVKPTIHEQKKRIKYKTCISRRENMQYERESDTYTCAAEKQLMINYAKEGKMATGLETAIHLKCETELHHFKRA